MSRNLNETLLFTNSMLFSQMRWAVFSAAVEIFFGQKWLSPPPEKLARKLMGIRRSTVDLRELSHHYGMTTSQVETCQVPPGSVVAREGKDF